MFNRIKGIYAVIVVVFLLAPLVVILPLAFTSSVFLNYPVPSFSTRWFEELVTAQAWRRSIVNSLIIAGGTTVLATTLGMAASLGLRNRDIVLGPAIKTVFLLPMVVPAVVLGVGMQMLFAKLSLGNSYLGVIIAHTVVAIPFVIISITGSLAGIDRRVERAAESLGASPGTVFRRVTLPLALPGVYSGAVLAFAVSLDEVVLTLFVAGPNQRTLARQMFSTIRENVSPAIAAAAFVFIVGTVIVGAIALLARRKLAQRTGAAA